MFNKFIIYKDNLINNVKQVKLNNPNSKICAMVKADAYGVGDKQVVSILNDYIDCYGVACFFEACKIKRYTNKKILIVGALEHGKLDSKFSYTCHSLKDIDYLIKQNRRFNIHIKINTGMNRFGFNSIKQFKIALNKILNSKLKLEGVFTHFATGDNFVKTQYNKFNKYILVLNKYPFKPIIHADNSIVQKTQNHNLDMVRVGFNLYNLNDYKYHSVVEIKSKVVQINRVKSGELVGYNYKFVANRSMEVAVVPFGYADGLDIRSVGLKLNVKNRLCKILNICMDCFMLDVTNLNIKKGETVYILNKLNSLKLFADYLNISEYQVMINFSKARADKLVVSAD